MNSTSRSRNAGFTLIELLIVVAIIGLLAAMLIPNLLDALDKAKQKRTMADERVVGTAMMAWLTDQGSAAAAGAAASTVLTSDYGTLMSESELRSTLLPQYLQELPIRDGWKNLFEFYLDTEDPHGPNVMLIRSRGKLGVFDGDSYDPGSFDPTDYEQDIVWADGFFVRWPQKG